MFYSNPSPQNRAQSQNQTQGRTSQGQRNQRMLIVGNGNQGQPIPEMYMADRLSPKQKISQEGQILSYNKQIFQQQYHAHLQSSTAQGAKPSPKSSQQLHRHPIQKQVPMNRTAPAQTALIDAFSLQQHNNYVNGPHQLATQMMRQPVQGNQGYSNALDETDLSALYPTSQSPLSYK